MELSLSHEDMPYFVIWSITYSKRGSWSKMSNIWLMGDPQRQTKGSKNFHKQLDADNCKKICPHIFFAICTVGKIQTPIFTFFLKRVVKIEVLQLKLLSNGSPSNSTYYRGILKFLKNNGFLKFYAVITISQKIL